MNRITLSLLAAGFALAFLPSCSEHEFSSRFAGARSISGVSQKGPFIANSSVTLQELDGSLAQTGNSFQGMTDGRGAFEIKGITLASPYVLLKAEGYYLNEITGENKEQITLYAIADVTDKSSMNANVLTHLEYHRVLALAALGKSLKEAKAQALGEILAVFGIGGIAKGSEDMSIFGAEDGDAALLAISVLLQGGLGAGDFSKRLGSLSQGLKEKGKWEDEARKAEVKAWACAADDAALAKIRDNIYGWGISLAVPYFEKYVRAYCGTQPSSSSLGSSSAMSSSSSSFSSSSLGSSSSSSNFWSSDASSSSSSDVSSSAQSSSSWQSSSSSLASSSSSTGLCAGFEDGTERMHYGKNKPQFCDERDGQRYVYVTIGSGASAQTWMAENLNYNASGSKCGSGSSLSNANTSTCDTYGRLYNWATAIGVCPQGWHLPSNADWNVLMKYVNPSCSDNSACSGAGTKLKANTLWNGTTGTDEFGFSALPGGYGDWDGNFSNVGNHGRWWSSSEDNSNNAAYGRGMDYNDVSVLYYYGNKRVLFSVRCLQG